MFTNIRIVLVNTTHPGNIGSAARAMKTMGLSRLYLVQPKKFPDNKAVELSSGAHELLDEAVVCDDLDSALEGCRFVIGTSAHNIPSGRCLGRVVAKWVLHFRPRTLCLAHLAAFPLPTPQQAFCYKCICL